MLGRHRDDAELDPFFAHDGGQVVQVKHGNPFDRVADFVLIHIERRDDLKPLLAEAAVTQQRSPQVTDADQRYVMYYTARSLNSSPYGGRQCVGIATSASPGGPFVDHATAPVLCNVAAGGTIDPSPYVADDGSVYLSYADDVGIKAQRVSSDGLSLAGGEQLLMHFDSGYPWELPRVEGPSMFSTPTTGIVLLYSAGTFSNAAYSVGAAKCDTPLGPCRHIYSTPSLSSRGSMFGPGGQTPFQLDDGSWQLAFHAWDNIVGYGAGGERTLHFLPLTFPGGTPAVG